MRIGLAALALGCALPLAPAVAQDNLERPTASSISLGIGKGTLVELPQPVADVFVANEKIADVQVRSTTQVYVFGTGSGETSVYATDRAGKVVWSSAVRVGQNIDALTSMLKLAMNDAPITATALNGMVLLTGDVGTPAEIEETQRLTQAFVGDKVTVVNKLRAATPMQVNLQVKIAEVSRDLIRQLGVNLLSRDNTGGFLFGVGRGRDAFDFADSGAVNVSNLLDGTTSINLLKRIAGVDIAAAIDLLERDNVITVLAEPNLTAISGETASFLAGGEFPIVVSTGLGQVSVEFKKYGVSLAFTPTVMSGERISMRVRPEVSELTDVGSVKLNDYIVPALTTRRAETTVELGSGQSFMIAGLLKNGTRSNVDKAPWLGDLPILGALFKSDRFRREETELVIVITPHLVKPMRTAQVKLPTDGYQSPNDIQRWFLGRTFDGKNSNTRVAPTMAPPAADNAAPPAASPSAPSEAASSIPAPGFSQ